MGVGSTAGALRHEGLRLSLLLNKTKEIFSYAQNKSLVIFLLKYDYRLSLQETTDFWNIPTVAFFTI